MRVFPVSMRALMYHREAREQDLLDILQLYRQYNQGARLDITDIIPHCILVSRRNMS